MTISVSDNTPRVSYSVSEGATQTSFTVSFEFFADADLNVYVDGTKKTLTTHYSVTGGDGSTGSISMSVTGASGGSTVVITRGIALERTTDFPVSGAFAVGTLNTELDRFVAIQADLNDTITRSIRLQDDDSAVSMELPLKAARLGTVLGFNASTGAVEAGPTIANVNSLSAITANINTVAGISSNVTTVAGVASNVTTVAGVASNVTTVAGIASNVTSVANDATDIGAVAGKATEIGRLGTSASVTSLGLLGTSDAVSDMNTLAAISSNITSVAGVASLITSDFVSDLNTLATSDVVSDLNTLATSDIVSDLNTLATSDIVSDMNTLATSDIVSDLNKLATDDIVSDLNTLATTDIVSDLNTLATSDIVTDLNLLATSAIVEDLNLLATSSVIADMATLAGSGASPNITSVTASGAITAGSFVIGSADINENDLEAIDGITAGTVAASKAAVVDTNKDITGFRNITLTGELDAGSLDVSGDADIDGTLEADAITVNGTTLTEFIQDTVGGMVTGNTETGIAVSYEDGDGTLDFAVSASPTASDDITTGDAAVTIATSTGNITFDAQGSDTDIIFKGTDGSSDTTFLTLDGSEAGAATFNSKIIATELDISGNVDIDGTLEADAITIDGTAIGSTYAALGGASFTGNVSTTGTLGIGASTNSSYDAEGNNLLIYESGASGHAGITIANDGNDARGHIFFADGTSSTQKYRGAVTYQHADDSMFFRTAATERFRFGSAGQFGIGGATYGTSGQVLTSGGASAAPTWANASSGALVYLAGHTITNSTTNNFSLDNIFTTDYDHYFIITRDMWISSSDYLNLFFLDSSGSAIDSGDVYKFAYQNAYNGTPTHQTDNTRNHLFQQFYYGGSANDNFPGYDFDFHVTFNRTISNDGVVAKVGGRYWLEWDKYFSWSAVLSEDNGTPRGLKFSVSSGSNSFMNGVKVNVYGYALS